MKKLVTLTALLLVVIAMSAQKVKIKDDIVLVEGKEVFSCNKNGWSREFSIFELGTENELIFIRVMNNGTPEYIQDDYVRVNFTTLDLELEHSTAYFGKKSVKWLFRNEVFNLNGELDEEKIKQFIAKYDENITDRTIRN
jgi:hypothetical protein